nr:murein transglycosylase [Amycolatopsis antarctica]
MRNTLTLGGSRGRTGVAVLRRLLVITAVVAFGAGGVWLVARASTPTAGPTTTEIPALRVEAASVEPGTIAPASSVTIGGGPAAGPGEPEPDPVTPQAEQGTDSLAGWADRVAPVAGVPARALIAYGQAELAMRAEHPECRISWATLAGIGRIESYHGQYGGATLQEDGYPSKPIIGVPLDGSPGVRAIADTDGGRFDGDTTQDRAVGPMQFIPGTWNRYASDGNNDGAGDPQQIDDAALGAGRYLCVGDRDMADAEGWWSGILSYNNSTEYAQKVFGLADGYAKAARTVAGG